jgi:predicted Na+-dependent transporter
MVLLHKFCTAVLAFKPEDVICVIFCGVHKSLTLGIPMLKIMFEDNLSSNLGQMCLPLLIYHPVQILLGGFMVPHLKSRLKMAQTKYVETCLLIKTYFKTCLFIYFQICQTIANMR